MSAILGAFGSGDWETDERPKSWREALLFEDPNGDTPITALLSMLPNESTTDYEFNWWVKDLATQAGAVTDVFTDASLTTSYTSGGVAGDALFVKVAVAVVDQFRAGHEVLLRDASDLNVDCVAKVTAVVKNGANSYMAISLLEADDNSSDGDISDVDRILIIGNINSQGAKIPDAISYTPTKFTNKTQIWRTPLNITRTARQTRVRTGDKLREMKREANQLHGMEQEKSLIYSIQTENTGSNNEPETTTEGLMPFIKANASANVSDFRTNSTYSGQTWIEGGLDFLDEFMELILRFGGGDRLVLCGSGAMLGINKLARIHGTYELKPMTTNFGIKVIELTTPFGVWNLKRHPLFSYETTDANTMLIISARDLRRRTIQETKYFKDNKDTTINYDGLSEEFLTEMGLEVHFPKRFGLLHGVGKDNTL